MAKTLCDWSKKEIDRNSDLLRELTNTPQYFCRKCARVANHSKILCKPRKLPLPAYLKPHVESKE